MSGTSADGVDAALIEVDPQGFQGGRPFRRLLGHRALPYPEALKAQVLAAAANQGDPASLCVLQRRLGDHHAEAAAALCAELGLRPDLAALHGQTVQHHPADGASLQLADPYVLAEALGCPVVWDLRRWDLAALEPAPRTHLLEAPPRKQHLPGHGFQAACMGQFVDKLQHIATFASVHHAIQVKGPGRGPLASIRQRHPGVSCQAVTTGINEFIGHIKHAHRVGIKAHLVVAHHHAKSSQGALRQPR